MMHYFIILVVSIFSSSFVFGSGFQDSNNIEKLIEMVSFQKKMTVKRDLGQVNIASEKNSLIVSSVPSILESPISVAFVSEPNFAAKPVLSNLSHFNMQQMRGIMNHYPYRLKIKKPTESQMRFSVHTLQNSKIRNLFNDLHFLEQSRVCDNQFNQKNFNEKYNELEFRSQQLKPGLSVTAQAYAEKSLNSLKKPLGKID